MSVWTARRPSIEKHRDVPTDFVEDMLVITNWFKDPKNHEEVAQIASKITKHPPERFDWLFTKSDNYRAPNALARLKKIV